MSVEKGGAGRENGWAKNTKNIKIQSCVIHVLKTDSMSDCRSPKQRLESSLPCIEKKRSCLGFKGFLNAEKDS